jgi:hypothetical protein
LQGDGAATPAAITLQQGASIVSPASSRAAPAALLAFAVFLAACTPAASASPAAPSPRASTGADPISLRFIAAQLDSVGEWALLHELDHLYTAETRPPAGTPGQPPDDRRDGMHGSGWLWMPAMMLVGGLIWLILDK